MTNLGPKRPKKKPAPKPVKFMGEDIAFIDGADIFEVGVSIYVCTNEDTPEFDHLESGTYNLLDGGSLVVIDGVISEIL
jgi:hypothetical protein